MQLAPGSPVLVLAAHPDDETLGAGGLLHRLSTAGHTVTVIVASDGAAGGSALARSDELRAAVELLAPDASLVELGFADGGLRETREELRNALQPYFDALPPNGAVVAPWRGDGHRDHRIVGEIAQGLVGDRMLLEYPIWMWHWAHPDSAEIPVATLRSITVDAAMKRAAIACFPSQTEGHSPMLRESFLAHFNQDKEFFFVTSGERAVDTAASGDRHETATTEHPTASLRGEYFDAVYEKNSDPWRLETRWYEERKRAATLAVLPKPRFSRALEIGCSVGMLTELLAERCDALLAIDLSERAVEQTRDRLAASAATRSGTTEVRQQEARLALQDARFDLIVFSEVGYYFTLPALTVLAEHIRDSLSQDGVLVACHWRHPVAEYPLSGDQVHEQLDGLGLHRTVLHEERDFLLAAYERSDRSVAQREGLA
ncbi:PIG-L family deacetylase [Humidisolicoccus flavus]|uniref:PIG-L family deacetylase n=1 Tax=Humidisolicoccus flavus TaxID=3111414 RepID=UPI0032443B71